MQEILIDGDIKNTYPCSDRIQNFKNRFSFASYLLTIGSLISF